MVNSTSIVTRVVPGLLSGSPTKFKLKWICQNISYNFAQIHTIPASWSVQTQLILNPSLHLPPVELLLLLLTGAGANLAAAGAYGELSSCLEFALVFPFEVNRQYAFPRWHIRKDIYFITPAWGFTTLRTLNSVLFKVNILDMDIQAVFAFELLYEKTKYF